MNGSKSVFICSNVSWVTLTKSPVHDKHIHCVTFPRCVGKLVLDANTVEASVSGSVLLVNGFGKVYIPATPTNVTRYRVNSDPKSLFLGNIGFEKYKKGCKLSSQTAYNFS